jgi:MFS family permease
MIKKMPFLIAIVLICVAPMGDTYILIPAMSEIAAVFPGASQTFISFILTISSLFVIPSSLIAGKLVEAGRLSKKGALLIGFSLFTIGGVAGGFITDIWYILFTRAVLGIGNGFATAMIVTVTADYFTEKESADVMGMYTAVGGVIAIGLTIMSGYLTLINWKYAFSCYALCALIVLYHAAVLKKNPLKTDETEPPEERRQEKTPTQSDEANKKPRLGIAIWILVAITIASQVFGNNLYLFLSIFIEGENIGDAASTGLANGILTVSIIVVSLAFGVIYNKVKKFVTVIYFVLMSAGFLLLAQCSDFATTILAVVIWGLGYGLTIPYIMQEAIVLPPPKLVTFTGAFINSCIFLSFVLSTFVQPVVAAIFQSESVRVLFNFIGADMIVFAILAAFYSIFQFRKKLRTR